MQIVNLMVVDQTGVIEATFFKQPWIAEQIRKGDTVALSGGVFMNRLLLQLLARELKSAGLTVLVPHTVPVNDGCIAYGQAAVASARLAQVASQ